MADFRNEFKFVVSIDKNRRIRIPAEVWKLLELDVNMQVLATISRVPKSESKIPDVEFTDEEIIAMKKGGLRMGKS